VLTDLLDRLDQAFDDWDQQEAVGVLHELIKEYQEKPMVFSSHRSINKALI